MSNQNPVTTVATKPMGLKTKDGKNLAYIGQIQERTAENIAKSGGRPWAAWVRQTQDGEPKGTPECFMTFFTLKSASRYVEVAVQDPTKDLTIFQESDSENPALQPVEAPVEAPKAADPAVPVVPQVKRGRGRPRVYCATCHAKVVPGTNFCEVHKV